MNLVAVTGMLESCVSGVSAVYDGFGFGPSLDHARAKGVGVHV